MRKSWILLLVMLVIPELCFSGERHITIGNVSFYVGQQSKNLLSNYDGQNEYKITRAIQDLGSDKTYYISRRDSNLIIGVLEVENGKISKITRHWVSGKDTVEDIGRALYESIKEQSIMDGAKAIISTEEKSNPDLTYRDITIRGGHSSVTISIVEGHGVNKYTHVTIFDTITKQQ